MLYRCFYIDESWRCPHFSFRILTLFIFPLWWYLSTIYILFLCLFACLYLFAWIYVLVCSLCCLILPVLPLFMVMFLVFVSYFAWLFVNVSSLFKCAFFCVYTFLVIWFLTWENTICLCLYPPGCFYFFSSCWLIVFLLSLSLYVVQLFTPTLHFLVLFSLQYLHLHLTFSFFIFHILQPPSPFSLLLPIHPSKSFY